MRIVEKVEPKVKPAAKERPESKTNMALVTSPACVSVRTTSADISATPVAFGTIGKPSIVASFTKVFKENFDIPGKVEFGKNDAEKIFGLMKDVMNDALKTAHVQKAEQNLSSVTIWSPTFANFKVAGKASRSSRNPALLNELTKVKQGLIEAGATDEQVLIHPDYAALHTKWVESETTTDNSGKSIVKIKEFTIEPDGTTPIDAALAVAAKNLAK